MINASLPPDIMDFCNILQHQLMFCDSKDVERISYTLSMFLQSFGDKNINICNEIHSKGIDFFFFLIFENSEGVALLLLLHVTKQQSNLAPAVSTGDVGVRDQHPSSTSAMSSASGAILVHGSG